MKKVKYKIWWIRSIFVNADDVLPTRRIFKSYFTKICNHTYLPINYNWVA
jgi:hypothetical protein